MADFLEAARRRDLEVDREAGDPLGHPWVPPAVEPDRLLRHAGDAVQPDRRHREVRGVRVRGVRGHGGAARPDGLPVVVASEAHRSCAAGDYPGAADLAAEPKPRRWSTRVNNPPQTAAS